MTTNQIRYWELQEKKRSNQASERELARSHLASEALTSAANAEILRHNVNVEAQAANDLLECARSNRATETLTARNIASSEARNAETRRANVANEVIGRQKATTDLINARTQQGQLGLKTVDTRTRQRELDETIRSNMQNETLRAQEIGARTASGIIGTIGSLAGRIITRRAN